MPAVFVPWRFSLAHLCAAMIVASPMGVFAQDADGDGVPDAADAFPCDPQLAAQVFVPAAGEHGMMTFEDQWPAQGDLDFNDVVLTHHLHLRQDAAGRTVSVGATFNLLALGGQYTHGLGWRLPVAASAVASVTRRIGSGEPQPLTASGQDAELTLALSPNLRELFAGLEGPINSVGTSAIEGAVMEVEIVFASPVQLAAETAPYDLFIFRSADPGHEIHLPQYAGTSRMNQALFGTRDDGSTPGRAFVDSSGLPFALQIPTSAPYPREGVAISTLFPDIVTFAASGGAQGQGFYTQNVNGAAAFAAVLVPRFGATPRVADRSCVIPGLDPGNPAIMCRHIWTAANGAVPDGVYWIDPDGAGGRPPFQATCDMSNGGWTGLVTGASTSLDELRRFPVLEDTVTHFMNDPTYGISWGNFIPSAGAWSSDHFVLSLAIPYDAARIVHTGFYDNPVGGLGTMTVGSDVRTLVHSHDAWTAWNGGQSLSVGGVVIFGQSQLNIVNRADVVAMPGSTWLRISMHAFTAQYGYTRRYIASLWVL